MMTSKNSTRLIERYLNGKLSNADRFIFEVNLVLNPDLKEDLYFQKKTHLLIKMYHRQKLKEELEALHQKIFTNPDKMDLRRSIHQLFQQQKL